MKKLMIYFSDDSDLVELETSMKECRGDVLVSCDGCLYQLDFVTINRLNKEYEIAQESCPSAYCLNNTVVVKNVKKDIIINAIIKIVESNEIKSFATIDLKQFYSKTFPELQDIGNWKRVY